MIQITTFHDQDADRVVLEGEARREVVDLLLQMDLVTSSGEGVGALESQPESAGYLEFRSWFGPRILQAMLSLVGRVLQASQVAESGRVRIDPDFLGATRSVDERVGLAGRLTWLVSEIPSLAEHYGQLYDEEVPRALTLCAEADALDLGADDGWSRALELWPELEILYKWAQPGARIARNDREAVDEARTILEGWQRRIEEDERKRVRRLQVVAGELEPSGVDEVQQAIEDCNRQIKESQSTERRLKQRLADLRAERSKVSERLTDLLVQAGSAGTGAPVEALAGDGPK